MKLTSKDKIINESLNNKIEKAKELGKQGKYWQAIQAYHKVLFLKQDPQYMFQLAEIYEKIMDLSSASLFYRRVHQLNNSVLAQQKVKNIAKIKGIQLLQIGSVKNILQDTEFECFIKRYPLFHKKLHKKISQKYLFGDYLESALAYLQVNHRQLALNQVDNCILIDDKDADLIVLKGMINWSIFQNSNGYKQFWNAYSIDRNNSEVQLFLQMITPEIQKLYKQAKYDLIDRKIEKCKLKVKKGLQIHPYHTQFLILSAYIHRTKQQYQLALSNLELANKHIEDLSFQLELKNQISLTYNQMGICLFKQGKFNEAALLFTQGLSFNPNDWGIYTNRGDCYRSTNDFVKALEDYIKAHQIQKKNEELNFRISSIYNMRGIALFNSKNYELALKQFDDALNFSNRCAQFHLSRAKCLNQLGKKQQSIESLQRCIQLDDKNIEGLQMLSQLKDNEQRKGKNNRKVIYLSKQK